MMYLPSHVDEPVIGIKYVITDKINDQYPIGKKYRWYFPVDMVEAINYVPYFSISSIEIFNYSHYADQSACIEFEKDLLEINKALRQCEIPDKFKPVIKDLGEMIKNSPVLNHEITVYRGISEKLNVKNGQILSNLGFIHVSLDRGTAEYFMNDTSECHTSVKGSDAAKAAENSTLFTIKIPPGTHMLDYTYFDQCRYFNFSELVLHKDSQLLVQSVDEKENYTFITATLF